MRWAVLLRGVNVGGNRRLPMADLSASLSAAGFGKVRTLLASGNAVVDEDGDANAAPALEARIERVLLDRFGMTTDVLVRSRDELDGLIAADPFPHARCDRPSQLLVTFHREPVAADRLDALTHDGPERLAVLGRELVVDFAGRLSDSLLPRAMARARFPRLATARNWNTVEKLAALLR